MTWRGLLRFAVEMAWRETRGAPWKMSLAVAVMAVASAMAFGVASLTAGFTQDAFENAREWIAADAMAVYYGQAPTPEQWSAVRGLGSGVESTLVAELTMPLSSDDAPNPAPAVVKVVDPAEYPYYGRVELKTGRDLRAILGEKSAVVSPDVLDALAVRIGDVIRLGQAEFRIADTIAAEPDPFAVPPLPVGRVIVSRHGFNRVQDFGATGFYRILLRTSHSANRRALCARLEEIFPSARVVDYTSRTPETAAIVGWVVPFLTMLGLLAIGFGALGIGVAIYFHLLRSVNTLAILKCLGATSRRIATVYFVQMLGLALIGAIAGLAGGQIVDSLAGEIAVRYFDTHLATHLHGAFRATAAVETVLSSLIVAAAAAWIPLSRIRQVSPFALLRRDAGEKGPHSAGSRAEFVSFAILLVIAFATIYRVREGRVWIFALLAAATAIAGVYAAAQLAIRVLTKGIQNCRLPCAIRQGITNLHRYRRQSSATITALAAGVAFITIALLGQWHLRKYILGSIPFRSPNLLVLRVDEPLRTELSRLLSHYPGVEEPPRFVPTAWVALERAGDSPLDAIRIGSPQIWIQRDWPASCSGEKPAHIEIVAGRWWSAGAPDRSVALTEDLARLFGVTV
ncbi:MAG: ABC transporter permease, partial [Bryobacteraceae bacterium]